MNILHMKKYTIPKSVLKYRLSSIYLDPCIRHHSFWRRPEFGIQSLWKILWGPLGILCKWLGLCQLYQQNSQAWDAHHMVLRLGMCIIMFLQLQRGGTSLPSNWNSVFRSTCLNQNHWAWTHHHVMIWRIGFSHMALLKVGGHFTVPGFRVCSILYISCLYILICVVTKLETSKSMQNTNPLSLEPHTGKTKFFFALVCAGSSVALRCDDSVSCLILPCHHCSSLCTESLLSSAALL